LFADHVERQQGIEQWWLRRLELPQSSLRKSHVNVYSKYSIEKADEQAAARDVHDHRPQLAHRADDLWVDPGVRRV
jgi:hypothetical protein